MRAKKGGYIEFISNALFDDAFVEKMIGQPESILKKEIQKIYAPNMVSDKEYQARIREQKRQEAKLLAESKVLWKKLKAEDARWKNTHTKVINAGFKRNEPRIILLKKLYTLKYFTQYETFKMYEKKTKSLFLDDLLDELEIVLEKNADN